MFISILVLTPVAHAQDDDEYQTTKKVDLAALNVQEQSIKRLKALAKKARGTAREPIFLSRLADLYLERSGISFRVSEGSDNEPKKKLYETALKECIVVLTELVNRYPSDPDAPYARFKRAKAYKELKKIAEAKADYLYLRTNAKNFEYLDSALSDLADFASDVNQYQEALTYLGEIEQMKHSEYYPITLHKAAWSYFNLAQFEQSLDYLKKEGSYYFGRIAKKKTNTSADEAFLDSVFRDTALFYFEAINKKSEFANANKGIDFIKNLDGTGQYFGPTVLRFTRLLKSYDLMNEMSDVKSRMIDDYINLTETTEITLLLFQYQFEKKNFKFMSDLLVDLNKIRKTSQSDEIDKKIDSVLSKALADLHKILLKKKNTDEGTRMLPALQSLTYAIVDLFGNTQATSVAALFSLAETQFELKDYQKSTELYLSLMKPEYQEVLNSRKISTEMLSLRLISSRYRELKSKHLISEKMEIRNPTDPLAPLAKDWFKKSEEWGTWIQDHLKMMNSKTTDEEKKAITSFQLEYQKLRYEYIDRNQALEQLENFAYQNSSTETGITAMMIVLDTYGKSESWQKIYDLTQSVLDHNKWNNKSFLEKARELSAQAYYRLIVKADQTAKTPDEVSELRKQTQICVKKFSTSKIAEDCNLLDARLELKTGNPVTAEASLTSLIQKEKNPTKIQSLLIMRADARTRQGKLEQVQKDLIQIQEMTNYKDSDISSNLLEQAWFKRDQKMLDLLLKNPKVCSGKNQDMCDRYLAIRSIDSKTLKNKTVYQNITKGPKALASIWALAGLQNPKQVPFNDRLNYIQKIGNTWGDLNPFVQIYLLPSLNQRVIETLSSIRASAPGIAPLTADENSVMKRLKLIQEVDNAFAKIMKLPWLEIKTKAAIELQSLYLGLLQELKKIETPPDLLKPFETKVQQIQEAIDTLNQLAYSYTQTKALNAWLSSKEIKEAVNHVLWDEWANSVNQKNYDYSFYLLSLLDSQNEDFKELSPLLRGLLLVQSGASTEGYELVKNAPDSNLKKNIIKNFVNRKQK